MTDLLTDHDLLTAYGRDGDEAAFEALAERHVDMIFAVSLRRSRNRQLAEEATQNVLLALAGKARSLSAQEGKLTGWLHKSTKFEVSKLQRREARIKVREEAYANQNMTTASQGEDETFQHLLPLLDEAIDHLKDPEREVIVRRYLEGQNFRSIGQALGISEDAAQKRTSRAFERLNQFFHRKTGLTVSTTAMVAGVSRHAAEAAPAACLDFAIKAISSGAVSAVTATTITTMSIGKLATLTAGIVILGGTTVYFVNKADKPPSTASSPPPAVSIPSPTPRPAESSRTESATLPVAAPAPDFTGGADPAEEMMARMGAVNPHPGKDEFAERLGTKHEQLLKDLTRELDLTEAQSASVKAQLDDRLESFRAALDQGPQPGDPEQVSLRKEREMVETAGGLINGDGLREDLAEVLSDTQLDAFDEWKAKTWQSQVESHAYTEFSKVAPLLDLTEDQKDRTFELLQSASVEVLEADSSARAFLALEKGQAPAQMDLTHPGDMEFITEVFEGDRPLTPGSPEFTERIMETVGVRIQKQVERLAPVLDEKQLHRYQKYLVEQSILGDFGIEWPTPESP